MGPKFPREVPAPGWEVSGGLCQAVCGAAAVQWWEAGGLAVGQCVW